MDVCTRKSLIATCSIDRQVKIWNYLDNTCEVSKYFDEYAYSIAFHPSGYFVVVGFNDKIRMLNIYENDLKCFKEINIKRCKEISFSNGGHLFAVANNSTI
jgi:WD40 repeat protein